MPSPRIYPVVPNNGTGPDYGTQIEALNNAVASLQQGLNDEASTRGQADTALGESINTLSGQVNTLAETVGTIATYNPKVEKFTVTGPITSNLEIELEFSPLADSVEVEVTTGPELYNPDDYTLSGNILTLKSSSPLVAVLANGDVLEISYSH